MATTPKDDLEPQGLSLAIRVDAATLAWLKSEDAVKVRGETTVRVTVEDLGVYYTESLYVMWQIIGILCEDANNRMQAARSGQADPPPKP